MPTSQSLTEGSVVTSSEELGPWLSALAAADARDHVVGLPARDPAPLVAPAAGGAWRVGHYAGTLTLDGLSLHIDAEGGRQEVEDWTEAAIGLRAASNGDESLAPLVAMFWTRAVDGASRHGPPAFRQEVPQVGKSVRGRLDVRKTVRLRAKGDTTVATLYRGRELDNPVTRAIVAADRVLTRQVGHGHWRTQRVEAILPQLHVAVGRRASIPPRGELERMRYTPITRAFKAAAELSSQVVRQDPVATTPRPGRLQGLLIDLRTVRRDAVLSWLRAARDDLRSELDDAGVITVRDASGHRSRVEVGRDAAGGLVLDVTLAGGSARRNPLPRDARHAAAVVNTVAAEL